MKFNLCSVLALHKNNIRFLTFCALMGGFGSLRGTLCALLKGDEVSRLPVALHCTFYVPFATRYAKEKRLLCPPARHTCPSLRPSVIKQSEVVGTENELRKRPVVWLGCALRGHSEFCFVPAGVAGIKRGSFRIPSGQMSISDVKGHRDALWRRDERSQDCG